MAIEQIHDDENESFSENDVNAVSARDNAPQAFPKTMRPALYAMLARWGASEKTYKRISETFLVEFNVVIDSSEVARIYDQNRNRIVELRKQQRGEIMAKAEPILNKTQMLMKKEVDRAWRDSEKRDALDLALEAGAITAKEHAKAIKRLRILSINDLVKIANHVTPDKPRGYLPALPPSETTPQLPPGNTPEASALAKALSEAVARGDEVEIQRILWNQNPSAQSSATVEAEQTENAKPASNS
jgi:hypothetical protein